MTKVNPEWKNILILGVLILLAILSIGACTALYQTKDQGSIIIPPTLPGGPRSEMPTRPAECVPLPYTNTYPNRTLTPTPDFSNPLEKLKPNFSPTVTPFSVTRTINLSPNANPNDLAYTYVFRCNGDMDLYVSGPEVDIDQAIDLKYGDVVIASVPPISLMGKHPPPLPSPLPTQSFPATVTSIPYPVLTQAVPSPTPLMPGDTNLKIEQLKMFSGTTGWALHADFQAPYVMDGKILRTEQGIQTWTDVSPPTPDGYNNLPAVAFLEGDTALAIYSKSLMPKSPTREITIRRTSDGGRTWQTGDTITLDQGPLMLVVQIQLLDAQNGFMLAKDDGSMGKSSVYIFETHDGGMHWDIVYNSVDHMQANDPNTLWVFGNYPYGGELFRFITKNDGFYSNGFLFSSHDGGKSWQIQHLSPPGDLADLESKASKSELYLPVSTPRFVSAQRGVLIQRIYTPDQVTVPPGSFTGLPIREYLYFTADGRQTWVSSPSPAKIGEAYLYQDRLAWFLGKDDADPATSTRLYETTDNGKTWTLILPDCPFPLGSEIQFIDERTGFAFDPSWVNSAFYYSDFDERSGKTFSIFSTTDGGHTWEEVVPKLVP